MRCPVCRAEYRASATPVCRRCGVDLAPLIQIHDQSVWHYQRAIAAFEAGDLAAAQQQLEEAIALNTRSADFHAFAGQLWALQGQFDRAVVAWQRAIALNPTHSTAQAAQQMLFRAAPQDRSSVLDGIVGFLPG